MGFYRFAYSSFDLSLSVLTDDELTLIISCSEGTGFEGMGPASRRIAICVATYPSCPIQCEKLAALVYPFTRFAVPCGMREVGRLDN